MPRALDRLQRALEVDGALALDVAVGDRRQRRTPQRRSPRRPRRTPARPGPRGRGSAPRRRAPRARRGSPRCARARPGVCSDRRRSTSRWRATWPWPPTTAMRDVMANLGLAMPTLGELVHSRRRSRRPGRRAMARRHVLADSTSGARRVAAAPASQRRPAAYRAYVLATMRDPRAPEQPEVAGPVVVDGRHGHRADPARYRRAARAGPRPWSTLRGDPGAYRLGDRRSTSDRRCTGPGPGSGCSDAASAASCRCLVEMLARPARRTARIAGAPRPHPWPCPCPTRTPRFVVVGRTARLQARQVVAGAQPHHGHRRRTGRSATAAFWRSSAPGTSLEVDGVVGARHEVQVVDAAPSAAAGLATTATQSAQGSHAVARASARPATTTIRRSSNRSSDDVGRHRDGSGRAEHPRRRGSRHRRSGPRR